MKGSSSSSTSTSRTPLFDNTNNSHEPRPSKSQSQSQSSAPSALPLSHSHDLRDRGDPEESGLSRSSSPKDLNGWNGSGSYGSGKPGSGKPGSGWIESVGVEILEELLRKDREKLDSMDEGGMTLLHRSVLANRLELVRVLVKLGANRTLASRDGWSALHLAAHMGNPEMLVFLLKS